jgi:hypothetical protein
MIECICIDDSDRPHLIPIEKWCKKGVRYKITHVYKMARQSNILGCSIYELPLDESCAPYEMFKLSRFGINLNDIEKLVELAKLCHDLDGLDLDELIHEQLELLN